MNRPKLITIILIIYLLESTLSFKCAYVTHIDKQGDEGRLKGALVLGNSIKLSGSTHDRIVMISSPLDTSEAMLLQSAGWNVMTVAEIDSPKEEGMYHPANRFSMTKIQLYNMDEYDRIIYLEPYMEVVYNIDHLCEIETVFAAVMRENVFDTSLIVITPSKDLYETMRNLVKISNGDYEGLDDGFFNFIFWNVNYCPYKDNQVDDVTSSQIECMQLPQRYNGDVVRYTLHEKWSFDPTAARIQEPYVINYKYTDDIMPWSWKYSLFIYSYHSWWYKAVSTYDIHTKLIVAFNYLWRQILLLVFFFHSHGYKTIKNITVSSSTHEVNSLQNSYTRVLWTTFITWSGSLVALLFSDFDSMNPVFNIIVFIQSMMVVMEFALFGIIGNKKTRSFLRYAYPFSLTFLLIALYYLPSLHIFSRIILFLFYFITVHCISFIYVTTEGPVYTPSEHAMARSLYLN